MNPWYLAWVRATGGGPNHEYMFWIQARWKEFLAEHDYPDRNRRQYASQLTEWLDAKYPEAAA